MPGRNGTGPMGQGPRTGGGRGRCGGASARDQLPSKGPGFGMDRSGARGKGWRHRHQYYATGLTGWQRVQVGWPGPNAGFPSAPSKDQDLAVLKQQAASVMQTLSELKSRIQELDKRVPGTTKKEPE